MIIIKTMEFLSNISGSTPGKTVYTCMLNKKGGIEADLTVSTLDEQGWDGSSHLFPVSSFDAIFTCGKEYK